MLPRFWVDKGDSIYDAHCIKPWHIANITWTKLHLFLESLSSVKNKNCPTQSIIAAPIPLLVAKVCKYVFSSVGTDTHAFIEGSGVRLFILLNVS